MVFIKEKFKYLILAIIITCLILPKPAFAFLGTGIFDFFNAVFNGVEEFTAPIAQLFILLGLSYIIGLGTLFFSSTLLQLIIQHPEWLSITDNTMVKIGWSFTAGLTNMFFILIFVFIALAIILKIETFQAKKLLPKLLIMALLVNFSLVFVGATVDVANIFYRTIVPSDGNFVPDIMDVLAKSGSKTLKNIIDEIVFLIFSFIIPIIGPFMQLGFVINLVATGFVGNVFLWIVEGAMLSMMSGILFTYAFLFLARIFVLQFLAMVAPVAFLCSVLPETKKYWDDWLKMVVEWNVFGVVTLLLLVVGLGGLNSVMPSALLDDVVPTLLSNTGLSWIKIPPSLMYYFFLFVYLSILLWFSRKYTPMMGDFLINQAKSLGRMVYSKGIKTFGKGAMAGIKKTRQVWKETREARREKGGKEKLGTRLRMGVGSRMSKRGGAVGKWGTRIMRGTTLETEKAKRVEKQVAQLKSTFGAKGEHLDDAIEVGRAQFKGPMKAALLQYSAETRGEAGIEKFKEILGKDKFSESIDEIIKSNPKKIKAIAKQQPKLIERDKVLNAILSEKDAFEMDDKGQLIKGEDGLYKRKDKDVDALVNSGIRINGIRITQLLRTEDGRKKIREEAVHKKMTKALTSEDIENKTTEQLNEPRFLESVARYERRPGHLNKLIESGMDMDGLQDLVEKKKGEKGCRNLGLDEIAKTNDYLARAPHGGWGKKTMRWWRNINIRHKNRPLSPLSHSTIGGDIQKKENTDKVIRRAKEKGPFKPRIRPGGPPGGPTGAPIPGLHRPPGGPTGGGPTGATIPTNVPPPRGTGGGPTGGGPKRKPTGEPQAPRAPSFKDELKVAVEKRMKERKMEDSIKKMKIEIKELNKLNKQIDEKFKNPPKGIKGLKKTFEEINEARKKMEDILNELEERETELFKTFTQKAPTPEERVKISKVKKSFEVNLSKWKKYTEKIKDFVPKTNEAVLKTLSEEEQEKLRKELMGEIRKDFEKLKTLSAKKLPDGTTLPGSGEEKILSTIKMGKIVKELGMTKRDDSKNERKEALERVHRTFIDPRKGGIYTKTKEGREIKIKTHDVRPAKSTNKEVKKEAKKK